MTHVAFLVAAALVPYLPESVAYRLFGWAGDLLWLFSPRVKTRVTTNLGRALGLPPTAPELSALTRASLRNLCWNYYELFRASSWGRETLATRIKVEGDEHLEAVLQQGRGAILLFVHTGSLEAIASVPALYPGWRFVALVERMGDRRLQHVLGSARARHGLTLIPVDEALRAVRLLRRNWILVLGADRDMTGGGVDVPFFGCPARLPVGGVQLSLRFGVPVMLIYSWRERTLGGSAIFHVKASPPLDLARTGDLATDTRAGVATVSRALESIVRARPDQWLANYSFWTRA
jgi:phosphatidylinositol dimannoside acyltransferase